MARKEQEAVTTNGLKTILRWEIHPLRLFTKYISVCMSPEKQKSVHK